MDETANTAAHKRACSVLALRRLYQILEVIVQAQPAC